MSPSLCSLSQRGRAIAFAISFCTLPLMSPPATAQTRAGSQPQRVRPVPERARPAPERARPGHLYAGKKLPRKAVQAGIVRERRDGQNALRRRGQLFRGTQIRKDLARMTSDPRDATIPGRNSGYNKMARWAARRLQSRGVLPAGDGKRGTGRYLQSFEWIQRYGGERARSSNVVGIRPGKGSTNEAVLVIAHLDGLSGNQKRWYQSAAAGANRVTTMEGYQGANDNASAVASLLYVSDEIDRLERFRGEPLERDVVFVIASAEEEGLKGAEAFARFADQFGDKRFVGVINFEMVGRGDPGNIGIFGGDSEAAADKNPVYRRALGIQGRTSKVARVTRGLVRDKGEGWFSRSDHYPFARGGIDSVMYLGDPSDYHTVEDRLDKLDPRTNQAVARHAFRLVVDLAERGTGKSGKRLPLKDSDAHQRNLNPFRGAVYRTDAADD